MRGGEGGLVGLDGEGRHGFEDEAARVVEHAAGGEDRDEELEGGGLRAEPRPAVGEAEELEREVGAAAGCGAGDDFVHERAGEGGREQADGVLEARGPLAATDHVEDGLVEGLVEAGRVVARRRRRMGILFRGFDGGGWGFEVGGA